MNGKIITDEETGRLPKNIKLLQKSIPPINLLRIPEKREVFESLLPFFVIFELSSCKNSKKKLARRLTQNQIVKRN